MIVITGGTGQLGSLIVEQLLKGTPPDQLGVTVRDPAKASALAAKGVHVMAADFADKKALVAAFSGADQVVLISVNQVGEPARHLHRQAIEAACKAGVGRVFYTSHAGARPDSSFAPAVDHADAEQALMESGLPFTSLRNGFYAQSALHLIGKGIENGEIRAPEDGPVSWTSREDLAEGAAAILAAPGSVNGVSPPLVAPQSFTMAELAAIASALTGREIKRTTLSDAAWRDEKVAEGWPAPMAEMLLGTYRAARRGDFAATDGTIEKLIGRRPQTMRDVLSSALAHTKDDAADH
jgi:NAD(P)H dehydrogenase (quinone)